MFLLTRHEESIKARLWFAFLESWTTFTIQSFTIFESLWTSSSSSSSLCQKAFQSFLVFQTLKTKLCYSSFSFLSPFAKRNSPRTNRLNSFCVSLLPFPKERRTNRLNSFVSQIWIDCLVYTHKVWTSWRGFIFSWIGFYRKASKIVCWGDMLQITDGGNHLLLSSILA